MSRSLEKILNKEEMQGELTRNPITEEEERAWYESEERLTLEEFVRKSRRAKREEADRGAEIDFTCVCCSEEQVTVIDLVSLTETAEKLGKDKLSYSVACPKTGQSQMLDISMPEWKQFLGKQTRQASGRR